MTARITALDHLLSQPINIPVFHEIALRLQQMVQDDTYRIEDVIRSVNEDIALATEMLRQANSTYYSGKEPITTLKNAIVRLGSQQVANLAFTASMATTKSDNPVINALMKRLWHHSHTVAITSSWLAVQVSHDKGIDINSDEVYLAGLFHDVGTLYLLKLVDKLISSDQIDSDYEIINELIEESKIQQGIRVLNYLKVPEIYSNAVERHKATDWKYGVNDDLVASVRLACKLHTYIEKGVNIDNTNIIDCVNEELALLNIEEIDHVLRMINAIMH